MALFKCKSCGGNLEVSDGVTVVKCDYCETNQTVPSGSDEKKVNLFNRANRLRMDCEFDKASGVYESIVSEYPEESEGYWGLVLCKFGIEYVDDVATGKKIPTCHRTNTTSIMDDSDFEQALENADVVAKSTYREEAKEIDKLQKKIIAVVENEEPYDVFICYKETDDITKQRTEDSAIAQDIYTELIKDGYKVFFSRVTLRDKAGTEYEPYIYAALKSAKIMLAIGTKFEYYDAVWVKNEWSRYISMMADDSSKHLIPCFKNLDAYDIPKELKNLQALDMGEVTFFKNLLDNVNRFLPKAKAETVVVQSQATTQTEPLLKRAFLFLEDGGFESADEYCEKVLDIDPECARAYLGKLMVELKVRKEEELANLKTGFDNNINYKKAIRFGYIKLKDLNLDSKYNLILERMQNAKTNSEYREVAEMFDEIFDWKDSAKLAQRCREQEELIKTEKYEFAISYMNSDDENLIIKAKEILTELQGWKDADILSNRCDELYKLLQENKETKRKNEIYENAIKTASNNTAKALVDAIAELKSLNGWRDSEQKIKEFTFALHNIEETDKKRQEYKEKYEFANEKSRIERCLEAKREDYELLQKKIKSVLVVAAFSFLFLIFLYLGSASEESFISKTLFSVISAVILCVFVALIIKIEVRKRKVRKEKKGFEKRLYEIASIPSFEAYCDMNQLDK